MRECQQCKPGTYQSGSGKISCTNCESGMFQPYFGKDSCELCSKGGYCNSVQKLDGGFTACPAGTYNDKVAQNNITACVQCPPGTYSTENGATRETACLPCPSGNYNNQSGKTALEINSIGKITSFSHFAPHYLILQAKSAVKLVRRDRSKIGRDSFHAMNVPLVAFLI